ncbi:4'-phosphopantetheinyl transferase family protein [Agarivorans sp. DSG3-1]|uniref:4'-phosphopantetheinyl transferase family protein n=1 Tax=Agarivorans sp. DSG3-1 TaxID=3342249 RepID=UPI00398F50E6
MFIKEVLIRKIPEAVDKKALAVFYNRCLADCANLCFQGTFCPADIQRNKYGQPYIAVESHQQIHLSLSHSGEYLAAMACSMPCGVDIERVKERPYLEMWQEIRHRIEPKEPSNLADFYQYWTRKEAAWKVFACQAPATMKDLPVVCDRSLAYKGVILKNLEGPIGYALSIAHL